jgi:hypothetical protein
MLRVIMLSVIMLSVIMLSVIMLNIILLSVVMLSVVMLSVIIAECRFAKCRYAECHHAECRGAILGYRFCAECHILVDFCQMLLQLNPLKLFEPKLFGFGTKMTGKTDPSGLYFKRITIINDHSCVISK